MESKSFEYDAYDNDVFAADCGAIINDDSDVLSDIPIVEDNFSFLTIPTLAAHRDAAQSHSTEAVHRDISALSARQSKELAILSIKLKEANESLAEKTRRLSQAISSKKKTEEAKKRSDSLVEEFKSRIDDMETRNQSLENELASVTGQLSRLFRDNKELSMQLRKTISREVSLRETMERNHSFNVSNKKPNMPPIVEISEAPPNESLILGYDWKMNDCDLKESDQKKSPNKQALSEKVDPKRKRRAGGLDDRTVMAYAPAKACTINKP